MSISKLSSSAAIETQTWSPGGSLNLIVYLLLWTRWSREAWGRSTGLQSANDWISLDERRDHGIHCDIAEWQSQSLPWSPYWGLWILQEREVAIAGNQADIRTVKRRSLKKRSLDWTVRMRTTRILASCLRRQAQVKYEEAQWPYSVLFDEAFNEQLLERRQSPLRTKESCQCCEHNELARGSYVVWDHDARSAPTELRS